MATQINTGTATPRSGFIPRGQAKTWHFKFFVIDDPALLKESFGLRYEVYCNERQFLNAQDYPAKTETDQFDSHAIHVAGTNQDSRMVGTVRLVLPSSTGFPLLEHCELFPEYRHLADKASQQSTAEISRLAISKLYRRRKNDGLYGFDTVSDFDGIEANLTSSQAQTLDQIPHRRTKPEIVLGLYKAMYQASKRQGITHWLAAMERSLLRLLTRYNIGFKPIGPEMDYFGPVVPYIAAISDIEESVYRNGPEMFAEFMKGLEPNLVPDVSFKDFDKD